MAKSTLPEVWLRGPLKGTPALLQPVAHALLQAREELDELMNGFPDELLWEKVAGMASPGFHLQHLTGVLDRLYTYARAEPLTKEQLNYLTAEGKPTNKTYTTIELVSNFNNQVDNAITQLRGTEEGVLTDFRGVGRAQLPSTVLGLYVHSAEHTMRHLGQLIVTVKVLRNK
ncbi:DinB family protein [Mucilaginibacter sp.]|jgi:hypothetical protein|uniref:DinB family protein n=1 Tax=Mucilaginibacter sp. TaxID=1882438 RepID=UPI003565B8BD